MNNKVIGFSLFANILLLLVFSHTYRERGPLKKSQETVIHNSVDLKKHSDSSELNLSSIDMESWSDGDVSEKSLWEKYINTIDLGSFKSSLVKSGCPQWIQNYILLGAIRRIVDSIPNQEHESKYQTFELYVNRYLELDNADYPPFADYSSWTDLKKIAISAMSFGPGSENVAFRFRNLFLHLESEKKDLKSKYSNLKNPECMGLSKDLLNNFVYDAKRLIGQNGFDNLMVTSQYILMFDVWDTKAFFGSNLSPEEIYKATRLFMPDSIVEKTFMPEILVDSESGPGLDSEELHQGLLGILGPDKYEKFLVAEDPVFGRSSHIPVNERPSVQDLRALLELESVYEVELQEIQLNDELETLPLRQEELKANFETVVNELLGDENFKRFEKSQYNFLN